MIPTRRVELLSFERFMDAFPIFGVVRHVEGTDGRDDGICVHGPRLLCGQINNLHRMDLVFAIPFRSDRLCTKVDAVVKFVLGDQSHQTLPLRFELGVTGICVHPIWVHIGRQAINDGTNV